jgi:hypothetical protein
MDSGHQTLDDGVLRISDNSRLTHVVVDDLGERSETVGRAGRVGDNGHVGLVSIEVDTANKHGGVGRRSRDNDFLGSTLQVITSLLGGGEDSGSLNDVVGSSGTPLDVGWAPLTVNDDWLVVDVQFAVLDFNGALEASVSLRGLARSWLPKWERLTESYLNM